MNPSIADRYSQLPRWLCNALAAFIVSLRVGLTAPVGNHCSFFAGQRVHLVRTRLLLILSVYSVFCAVNFVWVWGEYSRKDERKYSSRRTAGFHVYISIFSSENPAVYALKLCYKINFSANGETDGKFCNIFFKNETENQKRIQFLHYNRAMNSCFSKYFSRKEVRKIRTTFINSALKSSDE